MKMAVPVPTTVMLPLLAVLTRNGPSGVRAVPHVVVASNHASVVSNGLMIMSTMSVSLMMLLVMNNHARLGQRGDHGPAVARIVKRRPMRPIPLRRAIDVGMMDLMRNALTVAWPLMPSVSTMRSVPVTHKSAMASACGPSGVRMEPVRPSARMASRFDDERARTRVQKARLW